MKSSPFKCKFVKGFPYDVKGVIPDLEKLSKLVNFVPDTRLDDKLEELIEWYTEQVRLLE